MVRESAWSSTTKDAQHAVNFDGGQGRQLSGKEGLLPRAIGGFTSAVNHPKAPCAAHKQGVVQDEEAVHVVGTSDGPSVLTRVDQVPSERNGQGPEVKTVDARGHRHPKGVELVRTRAIQDQVSDFGGGFTDVGTDGPQRVEVPVHHRGFEGEVEQPCAVEVRVSCGSGFEDQEAAIRSDEKGGDAVNTWRVGEGSHGRVRRRECGTHTSAQRAHHVPVWLQITADGPHATVTVGAEGQDVHAGSIQIEDHGPFECWRVHVAPRFHRCQGTVVQQGNDLQSRA